MSDFSFGYCTNVHAGITLHQAKHNLESIAARVRRSISPEGRLPVGLWLAEDASLQLESADQTAQFRQWLAGQGLKAYTFNGFPQGDFHQPVVKHAVYQPTWLDTARLYYTQRLASILVGLLDEGQTGSISTLPLGWPHRPWSDEDFRLAGKHLRLMAEHLDRLAQTTGHEIVLAIEPEPGCVLDTAPKITDFLSRYVFEEARPFIRRFVGVCHDICHSAVMFESQADAVATYLQAGVRLGKVQVSSAIEVPWDRYPADHAAQESTHKQLKDFNEPKYLHQTTRQVDRSPESLQMVEDLGLALEDWLSPSAWPDKAWRIHFHVPIYVERFGNLLATQGDIREVVKLIQQHQSATIEGRPWFTGDYEVETYAWGVLPAELRVSDLADGICNELVYFDSVLRAERLPV